MAKIVAKYPDLIFTVLIFTVTRLLLEQAWLWQGSKECKTKGSSSSLWGTPNAGSLLYVPSHSLARWGRNCLHSSNRTAGPVLYFPGKCSLERHNFRMITQLPMESVDQFVTRLREKADCCEFGETADENIRDQVIEKCLSNCLRRKLFKRGRNLTLNDLQTIARAMEASDRQAGNMENSNQAKSGLNTIQDKQERRCLRCNNTGHLQDDKVSC